MLHAKNTFRDALIFIGSTINYIMSKHNGDRIIALHDVPDMQVFREKIIWLKSNYDLVSMEEMINGNPIDSRKRITLTFDDGYENWFTNAAPVLEEFEVPAIFFVNSGLINLEHKNANDFLKNKLFRKQNLKLISMESLIELSTNPLFEIGGHSRSHLNLANIDNSEELYGEIVGDKFRLEQIIGEKIRWFAYPFGGVNYINLRVSEVVKSCGYLAAFSIIPSSFKSDRNKFQIGRDCLELSDSVIHWGRRLNGGYDNLAKIRGYLR